MLLPLSVCLEAQKHSLSDSRGRWSPCPRCPAYVVAGSPCQLAQRASKLKALCTRQGCGRALLTWTDPSEQQLKVRQAALSISNCRTCISSRITLAPVSGPAGKVAKLHPSPKCTMHNGVHDLPVSGLPVSASRQQAPRSLRLPSLLLTARRPATRASAAQLPACCILDSHQHAKQLLLCQISGMVVFIPRVGV